MSDSEARDLIAALEAWIEERFGIRPHNDGYYTANAERLRRAEEALLEAVRAIPVTHHRDREI